MCNLYRHGVKNADIQHFLKPTAMRLDARSMGLNIESDYCGADQDGPIIRRAEKPDTLEIVDRRWGLPGIKKGAKPITNIRNLESRWWKNVNGEHLTKPEYRCLVPFERFAEWSKVDKGNAWFEIDAPQCFFAGIWRPWKGERLTEVEGKKRRQRQVHDWELFAFLTTEPNDVVAAVHPKAMPVILTTPGECDTWLGGGADSFALQRPLPSEITKRVH